MKKINLITKGLMTLALLAGLSSCKSSGDHAAPEAGLPPTKTDSGKTPVLNEGGISAGGGGTLPANPIGVDRVTQIVGDARVQLRLYFNYRNKYHPMSEVPNPLSIDKFFFGTENLATQLEKTDVEILNSGPCHDRNGHEVDASIIASRPNTICISAFRIAPKLIEEIANKEIVALLAHEISHFLGSSEEEAVELQQMTTAFFDPVSRKDVDSLDKTLWSYTDTAESMFGFQEEVKNSLASNDLTGARTTLENTEHRLEATVFNGDLPFSFIDYRIIDYQRIMDMELFLSSWYLHSLDPNDKDAAQFAQRYDTCFAGQDQVYFKDLLRNCGLIYETTIYPDYVVHKLKQIADVVPALLDAQTYVRQLSSRMRAIAFDQPFSTISLPTDVVTVHPWVKFIGKYNAEMIHCESTAPKGFNNFTGLQSFEISNEVLQYPTENLRSVRVFENYGQVHFTNSYYNGDSGQGVMTVSGDDLTAVMNSESGTRWFTRQFQGWTKITKTISQVADSDLTLDMSSDFFRYNYDGVQQWRFSCQYKLTQAQ